MEIISLRIDKENKGRLEQEAKKLGMTLTTYCRMILLKTLQIDSYKQDEQK